MSHPELFLSLMQRKERRKCARYSLQFCLSSLDMSRHVWTPGWTVSSWDLFTLSPPHPCSKHCAYDSPKCRVGILISPDMLLWYRCHLLGTRGSLNSGDFFPPTCGLESKTDSQESHQKTKSRYPQQCGPRLFHPVGQIWHYYWEADKTRGMCQ